MYTQNASLLCHICVALCRVVLTHTPNAVPAPSSPYSRCRRNLKGASAHQALYEGIRSAFCHRKRRALSNWRRMSTIFEWGKQSKIILISKSFIIDNACQISAKSSKYSVRMDGVISLDLFSEYSCATLRISTVCSQYFACSEEIQYRGLFHPFLCKSVASRCCFPHSKSLYPNDITALSLFI